MKYNNEGKIYNNPILPGFYPDPSICRVNDDYYLVCSSFEFFPGLPIFHSRDLYNWIQIGHVLDRPSQLNLDKCPHTGGLWAPTIRYHKGLFYISCTNMPDQGNFYVTTEDPAGDWSEPVWLKNARGIDPSLFFDDDDKCWYCGNRFIEGQKYRGECEIWLQELDLKNKILIGNPLSIWQGALKKSFFTEGPHIFKKKKYYYLITAEGGTGYEHSICIARSEQITGPYESFQCNPVMTHRHLGYNSEITAVGHCDLVETQYGDWWSVMLGSRPYGGEYDYNLGRETFLAPVEWQNDWPVFCPLTGKLENKMPAPALDEFPVKLESRKDDFNTPLLEYSWNFLRTPRKKFYSLTERPGYLRLKLQKSTLSEICSPSFIGRRQQHKSFSAITQIEFNPAAENESAGMVCFQNAHFFYEFIITLKKQKKTISIIKHFENKISISGNCDIPDGPLYLCITGHLQNYSFSFSPDSKNWIPVANNEDGRILSTSRAGGFTGAYIGIYASANGKNSSNQADFDYFEYNNL